MTMARREFTVTDEAGNVVPGAHIEVRKELPGAALASLKSDRDGLVAMSNPFDADSDGFAAFHVVGGAYKVRAYTGASGAPTFEKIWRYVPVGLAAEADTVLPVGDVVTLTDTQTLTSKTINGADNTLTVRIPNDVSGTLPVANGGTGDTGTAWTAFTPTLTAGSGAFTTATVTGKYKAIGKTIFVTITATITTNGSAGSYLGVTLPFNSQNTTNLLGREMAINGAIVVGTVYAGTSLVQIVNGSNGYPGANGAVVNIFGVYERP